MKFFVYGTLKDDRADREKATVKGQMISCGGFPAVMLDQSRFGSDKNKYIIEGEIIDTDDVSLKRRMDSIEGIPYLYTKEKIKTLEGDDVFIYQGNEAWDDEIELIEPDEDNVVRWHGRQNAWGVYESYGV